MPNNNNNKYNNIYIYIYIYIYILYILLYIIIFIIIIIRHESLRDLPKFVIFYIKKNNPFAKIDAGN